MLGYKWLVAAACAGLLMASSQSCSMNEDRYSDDFRKALEKSGFLHEPLTVSEELSYENLTAKGKVIEASMPVEGSWKLVLVNDTGVRATGSPDDPDYATYGNFHIDIPVNVTDSETGYNRISFMVHPGLRRNGSDQYQPEHSGSLTSYQSKEPSMESLHFGG